MYQNSVKKLTSNLYDAVFVMLKGSCNFDMTTITTNCGVIYLLFISNSEISPPLNGAIVLD